MPAIGEAIKQEKFKSEYIKADINIAYTYSYFSGQKARVLKEFDISLAQFNILRILKGLKGEPASIKLLAERMIDKMSNASRLVEKLKNKGLVNRYGCPNDRRQVEIFITEKGMEVIEEASKALEKSINDSQNISEEEARELNHILDKMRG
jgi:DNA-binding MarR family transcriptional regulator